MGSKGRHRTHCIKCNTERILLKNGRYICPKCTREDSLKHQKMQYNIYPKQINEHNALSDAIFCRNLYKFLNTL